MGSVKFKLAMLRKEIIETEVEINYLKYLHNVNSNMYMICLLKLLLYMIFG